MSKLAKALTAAAGNAAGESLYVEDVFSTYLYEGDGQSNRDIVNGVNLADNGGLVWLKTRSTTYNHFLANPSEFTGYAQLPLTSAWTTSSNIVTFNTDGFRIPIAYSGVNAANSTSSMSSWSFRKAEKFFDVVTYTGSAATQNIAHNLGSTPGMIIIKRTDTGPSDWIVYHQGLNNGTDPEDYYLILNGTASENNAWIFNKTAPTDTTFTVGGGTGNVNTSGGTYVAYLFASDAGGFGDDGSENIIKCGSYTGNGSTDGPVIDLGFEPQWLLIKNTSSGGNWVLMDAMRGMPVGDEATVLLPNASGAESSYANLWGVDLQANGFKVNVSQIQINESGGTMVYIAIRRPMKTPESGTEVFAVDDRAAATPAFVSDFPVDLYWRRSTIAGTFRDYARLRGDNYLQHDGINAETSGAAFFDLNTGVVEGGSASTTDLAWMFKRATGFFDVVAYTGTGSTAAYQSNLGVPVEFVIVKRRDSAGDWYCWHTSFGQSLVPNIKLNSNAAKSSATLAVWLANPNLANYFWVTGLGNTSGADYISYHFATLDGVSKVGSYTGTGSNVDVDCGFSAGARFILIKRTDSTGDWYVYDYFRGIVSGNDPYLLLNTGTGEVTSTDYIDPLNSGFTVTSSAPAALNASGGNYIFLAIA